jgi:hypothetical protein
MISAHLLIYLGDWKAHLAVSMNNTLSSRVSAQLHPQYGLKTLSIGASVVRAPEPLLTLFEPSACSGGSCWGTASFLAMSRILRSISSSLDNSYSDCFLSSDLPEIRTHDVTGDDSDEAVSNIWLSMMVLLVLFVRAAVVTVT